MTPSHAIGVRHLFVGKQLFLITVQLRIIPAYSHVPYSWPALLLEMLMSGISSGIWMTCWSPHVSQAFWCLSSYCPYI